MILNFVSATGKEKDEKDFPEVKDRLACDIVMETAIKEESMSKVKDVEFIQINSSDRISDIETPRNSLHSTRRLPRSKVCYNNH